MILIGLWLLSTIPAVGLEGMCFGISLHTLQLDAALRIPIML